MADPVDHPSHYTDVVPGIECIDVTEHFSFLRGNAIKYLWRAGAKGDVVEDLKKARWYVDREIRNLEDVALAEHGTIQHCRDPHCSNFAPENSDWCKNHGVDQFPPVQCFGVDLS